jgi:hypothetical protein
MKLMLAEMLGEISLYPVTKLRKTELSQTPRKSPESEILDAGGTMPTFAQALLSISPGQIVEVGPL